MPEAEDIVIPHTLLLKLPTEIICQILDYMTLYDLQAITLTCRQIREPPFSLAVPTYCYIQSKLRPIGKTIR